MELQRQTVPGTLASEHVMTTSLISINRLRLNPFAFPSDTGFRFGLLVIFIVCSSALLYGELWSVFHPSENRAMEACVLKWFQALNLSTVGKSEASGGAFENTLGCLGASFKDVWMWKATGVVLTMSIGAVLYWSWPIGKIWWGEFQPLSSADAPEIVTCIEELCREAGLQHAPSLLCNPFNPNVNAIAFGRIGQNYLGLSGALLTTYRTDEPAFRAVVRHELAHLGNADVSKTYLTVALWWAFVVVVLVPSGAAFVWRRMDNKVLYTIATQGIASTIVVLCTRNAVLRVREFYADVRASVWDGPAGGLAHALQTLSFSRLLRGRVLSVHPHPHDRLQVLTHTERLFHLGFWDACGAGYAAIIALLTMQSIPLVFYTPSRPTGTGALTLLGLQVFAFPLFFFSLAVSAVGIGTLRGAFAALMRRGAPREALRLGAGLASGTGLGISLMTLPVVFLGVHIKPGAEPASGRVITLLVIGAVFWITLLLASYAIIFKWFEAVTSAWLEVILHSRSPNPILLITVTVGTVLVALWFGTTVIIFALTTFFLWHPSQIPGTFGIRNVSNLFIVMGLFNYLPSIAVWGLPLAAWFWRRPAASERGSRWAFLEGMVAEEVLPSQAQFRPRAALVIGLAAGLVYCAVLTALRFHYLPRLLTAEMRAMSVDHLVSILAGLSVLMQAGAAAIAAIAITRLGTLHGLFSAFIASCVIGLGWQLLAGGVHQWSEAFGRFAEFSMSGELTVLLIALAASTVADFGRRVKMKVSL